MKSQTSSNTWRATTQAGRIASKSRSLLQIIIFKSRLSEHQGSGLEPPLEAAFLQKAIVMPHQEMRFHLAHGIQHYADQNQHTGSAEESRQRIRHFHLAIQNDGNNCYNR